jgi:hypothetical protein
MLINILRRGGKMTDINENILNGERERFLNDAFAFDALRETGYRNTAYAIAELIDNSIDAGAENIDIILHEEEQVSPGGRRQDVVTEIGLMDDGYGFDKDSLARCLSIGQGTKLGGGKKSIGKFGYGLKGGSISQCRRTEVYTWQNNEKPLMTYLDLDEIKKDPYIPIPSEKEIPKHFHKFQNKESGTLIIWQKCDQLDFTTQKGLMGTLKEDLERIFRHFLDDNNSYGERRSMCMHVVGKNPTEEPDRLIPNDPLYMLKPNSLPEINIKAFKENYATDFTLGKDLTNTATNDEFARYQKEVRYIDNSGNLKTSTIEFIFTIAKPSIQKLGGGSELGQHYRNNDDGISFVRAGREIEFSDKNLLGNQDERNRWWGAEVRFNDELDVLFGVDAAKQRIRNIKKIRPEQISNWQEAAQGDALGDLKKALNLLIYTEFNSNVNKMMSVIKGRGVNKSTKPKQGDPQKTLNDDLKKKNPKTRSSEIAKAKLLEEKLKEARDRIKQREPEISEEDLEAKANDLLELVLTFNSATWDKYGSFMECNPFGNGLEVVLNTSHPFYDEYYYQFQIDESTQKPHEALKIILQCYAHAEDSLSRTYDMDGKIFPRLRSEWGKFIAEYLELTKLVD